MVVKAEVNKAIRLSDGERPQSLPFLLSEKAGDDGDGWISPREMVISNGISMAFLMGFIDLSEISWDLAKLVEFAE
jgi:hypothetical protein